LEGKEPDKKLKKKKKTPSVLVLVHCIQLNVVLEVPIFHHPYAGWQWTS
jgi:hypothetical protein